MRSAHLCFLFKGTIINCFDRVEYYESRYEYCNEITTVIAIRIEILKECRSVFCACMLYIYF